MGGIYLRGARARPRTVATAVRWHYHPIVGRAEAEPAAAFAGQDGDGARLRRRAARRQARHPGRLLRPRLEPDRQPRPLRPAPRRPGRRPRRARLLAAEGRRAGPRPRGARRGGASAATASAQAARRGDARPRGVPARPPAVRARRPAASGRRGRPPSLRQRAAPPDAPRRPACAADAIDVLRAWRRCSACAARPRRTSTRWPWPSSAPRTSSRSRRRRRAVDAGLFEADGRARALRGRRRGSRARPRAPTRPACGRSPALRAPVDRFFDDVLVMAEDPQVRANRLALLDRTLSLFYRIADISKLGG